MGNPELCIQRSHAKYQPYGGRFVLNPIHLLEDRLLRAVIAAAQRTNVCEVIDCQMGVPSSWDYRLAASATDIKRPGDPANVFVLKNTFS